MSFPGESPLRLDPRKRRSNSDKVSAWTKSLSFWPFRYLTDPDADDLLRLLEDLGRRGKHVAIMAHYNHWRELETPQASAAIRRVVDTGAVIRSQAPA